MTNKHVDFTKLPVGTEVVTSSGPGKIEAIDAGRSHPLKVRFDSGLCSTFTADGKAFPEAMYPIVFLAPFEWPTQSQPEQPLEHKLAHLKIDDPIYVRDRSGQKWFRRHFAGIKNGKIETWSDGRTSFTAGVTDAWKYYKLVDPEQPFPESVKLSRPHDYKWSRVLELTRLHKWFMGKKLDGTVGLAVADESGDEPHETDDGVLWLDPTKTIVVEGNRIRADGLGDSTDYLWRCPATIHLIRDDGSPSQLGGTNGYEAVQVYERFARSHNLSIKFEAVTDMVDD